MITFHPTCARPLSVTLESFSRREARELRFAPTHPVSDPPPLPASPPLPVLPFWPGGIAGAMVHGAEGQGSRGFRTKVDVLLLDRSSPHA